MFFPGRGAGLVQVSAAAQFDRDVDPLDPFGGLSEPQPGAVPSRLGLDLDRGPAGPLPEVRLPPPGVTEREDPSFVPAHRSIPTIMVDTLTIIASRRVRCSFDPTNGPRVSTQGATWVSPAERVPPAVNAAIPWWHRRRDPLPDVRLGHPTLERVGAWLGPLVDCLLELPILLLLELLSAWRCFECGSARRPWSR